MPTGPGREETDFREKFRLGFVQCPERRAQKGPPRESSGANRVGRRRHSEVSELSAAAESEEYGACSDDGQVSRETENTAGEGSV